MRIFEVDQTPMLDKLKALIDHPNTEPNLRAIAKKKYDAELLRRTGGDDSQFEISATTPSGYSVEVTSTNWNNIFINRDGRRFTFLELINVVRRLNPAPSKIAFSSADQQANKLNASRVVFNAKARPTITLHFTDAAPERDKVLDTIRQLTRCDWNIECGHAIVKIGYKPDENYDGERKSS